MDAKSASNAFVFLKIGTQCHSTFAKITSILNSLRTLSGRLMNASIAVRYPSLLSWQLPKAAERSYSSRKQFKLTTTFPLLPLTLCVFVFAMCVLCCSSLFVRHFVFGSVLKCQRINTQSHTLQIALTLLQHSARFVLLCQTVYIRQKKRVMQTARFGYSKKLVTKRNAAHTFG